MQPKTNKAGSLIYDNFQQLNVGSINNHGKGLKEKKKLTKQSLQIQFGVHRRIDANKINIFENGNTK